jgi:hypothetical protein
VGGSSKSVSCHSDRKEPTMLTNLRVRLPAAALVLLLVLVAAG